MSKKARIYKKNGNWYFIGTRFQGSHVNLLTLLHAAKAQGEG